MGDTVIAPRYQMRYEQLVNTPVLDRIPYFHDREIEYILEVSKAEQENVALRARTGPPESQPRTDLRPMGKRNSLL